MASRDGGVSSGPCGEGAWARLLETGGHEADGGLAFVERCEAVPQPAPGPVPRQPSEEEVRAEAERLAKVRGALETAVRQCSVKKACPGGATPQSEWSCRRAEGTFPVSSFDCPALVTMEPPSSFGCPGEWVVQRVCPPLPRPGCKAGVNQCCLDDGRVVGACGPRALPGCVGRSTLCKGPGGWCDPCR